MDEDDLDRVLEQIRTPPKKDHSELWAELDRDNEVRRAYRSQGLEPPTTWDSPAANEQLPREAERNDSGWQRICDLASRAVEAVVFVIGAVIKWSLIAAAVYWAWSYIYDWQYGPLSTSRYENFDVGVWVTPPEGDAVYLGITRGAEACNSTAWDYARRKGYGRSEWGYVCCTHRNGSTCYEKIR